MNNELRSGDLLIGPIDGVVPGFFPVAVGQGLLFLSRRWWRMVRSPRRWWSWRHVGVIDTNLQGVNLIQAMPRGCEIVPLGTRAHESRYLFIRPDYASGEPFEIGWEHRSQGFKVAHCARQYVGTPYGFLTYVKLAAGALRFRWTEAWLRKALSTRRDMICSQHVDQSLADAGYHVFDDGRLPQDVVPAELADALLSRPGWFMIPGHPIYGEWTDNARFNGTRF